MTKSRTDIRSKLKNSIQTIEKVLLSHHIDKVQKIIKYRFGTGPTLSEHYAF